MNYHTQLYSLVKMLKVHTPKQSNTTNRTVQPTVKLHFDYIVTSEKSETTNNNYKSCNM